MVQGKAQAQASLVQIERYGITNILIAVVSYRGLCKSHIAILHHGRNIVTQECRL